MNDAVDRVLADREALDRGFSGSVVLSMASHGFLVGSGVLLALILPQEPLIKTELGFAVVLPRGGGTPEAPAPEAAPAAPEPQAPAAVPEPPPRAILKPPKEELHKNALPELDAKPRKKKPPPEPRANAASGPRPASPRPSAGTPGGTGVSSRTPGLVLGPSGPGIPEGTDTGGDWYLATVQQKIWMMWMQQLRAGFTEPVGVSFTILADGSVDADSVRVDQPSHAALLNLAAQRAVISAAPFGPLPKDYGTNRYTIHALFKPTS